MSRRAIADTSLFIARETGRPLDPYEEDREIAVSIVTIGCLDWMSVFSSWDASDFGMCGVGRPFRAVVPAAPR